MFLEMRRFLKYNKVPFFMEYFSKSDFYSNLIIATPDCYF